MELNAINNTDKWGATAARLNENFSKVSTEVEKIKNATSKNKGLFASEELLKAAYPSPAKGDWAVVGNTIPGQIYRCNTTGSWTATGETGGGGEINLADSLKATEITDITTIL